MSLVLYHAPSAVCAQKVRLALAEKGVPWEGVALDLQKGDQVQPDYLKLNPNGVVPTLVHDDFVLVESNVIVEYIDRIGGGASLLPKDPKDEARARLWLLRTLAVHVAINSLTFATMFRARILSLGRDALEAEVARLLNPLEREKRRDLYERGPDSVHVAAALATLAATFRDMDAALASARWLSGEEYGLADLGLLPFIDRLRRLGLARLWETTPRVGEWLSAASERPSYAEAIEAYVPTARSEAALAGFRPLSEEILVRSRAAPVA